MKRLDNVYNSTSRIYFPMKAQLITLHKRYSKKKAPNLVAFKVVSV